MCLLKCLYQLKNYVWNPCLFESKSLCFLGKNYLNFEIIFNFNLTFLKYLKTEKIMKNTESLNFEKCAQTKVKENKVLNTLFEAKNADNKDKKKINSYYQKQFPLRFGRIGNKCQESEKQT